MATIFYSLLDIIVINGLEKSFFHLTSLTNKICCHRIKDLRFDGTFLFLLNLCSVFYIYIYITIVNPYLSPWIVSRPATQPWNFCSSLVKLLCLDDCRWKLFSMWNCLKIKTMIEYTALSFIHEHKKKIDFICKTWVSL